jgi:hypothetical protein
MHADHRAQYSSRSSLKKVQFIILSQFTHNLIFLLRCADGILKMNTRKKTGGSQMFIPVGIVFIAYGLSQIYLKDLWWWDHALMFQAFGKIVERSREWEHQQDLMGFCCIAAGVFLLIYNMLSVM